jgi:hypothetical protein
MIRTLALGIALSLGFAAVAHAGTRRCAPLEAENGETCACAVLNYGTNPDADVTIAVFGGSNPPAISGPNTIDAGRDKIVGVLVETAFTLCGCEVTGASSSSKVSLFTEAAGSNSAKAAAPCD